MHKRATRINKAIRCRPNNKWFTTDEIDLDAHILGKAQQTSAILSEMKLEGLLETKQHPDNKRASLYRKLKGANEFLDRRIAKAKPATDKELVREMQKNIDVLKIKELAA